jgi:D-alanine-D-alanine ligase-like ATP-grasp enzyme
MTPFLPSFYLYKTHIFVTQVNPISGLLPDHSPLPACAESNGISYAELLEAIIESALGRCGSTFLTNGSS